MAIYTYKTERQVDLTCILVSGKHVIIMMSQ